MTLNPELIPNTANHDEISGMETACHGCMVCNGDAYASEAKLRDLPIRLSTMGSWAGCGLIRVYQMTLSKGVPSNTCRFYPSCSHYAYQAIYKYGLIRGGVMGMWRILRCNPFNPGGFDPVP